MRAIETKKDIDGDYIRLRGNGSEGVIVFQYNRNNNGKGLYIPRGDVGMIAKWLTEWVEENPKPEPEPHPMDAGRERIAYLRDDLDPRWRPMETAPQDGTMIEVQFRRALVVAKWGDAFKPWPNTMEDPIGKNWIHHSSKKAESSELSRDRGNALRWRPLHPEWEGRGWGNE